MSNFITPLVWVLTIFSIVDCEVKKKFSPSLIDTDRKQLLDLEIELWRELAVSNVGNEVVNSDAKERSLEVAMMEKLEKFGDKLDTDFTDRPSASLDTLQLIPLYAEVDSLFRSVDALYRGFRSFQRQQTASGRIPSPKQAWIDFTEAILNEPNYPIPKILDKINGYVVNGSLFQKLLKELDSNSVCLSNQSPNQLLYNLYNTISLTEIKGYAMIQYSYTLLELYKSGSFATEAKLAREKFINRSLETAEEMRNAMDIASTHFWRCDPEKFVKNENYLEITQLLQGYIQNEVDLNPEGTCKEDCSYYQYTKSHSCYQNLYCRQQRRCKGRIFNCRYVDSDMWVCPALAGSGRRYGYVEYENGRVLGRKEDGCPNTRVKVDSWWRWLFWHCSYCLCLCDEEGIYSDRYISLLPAESNITKNKIVTGLRFLKHNRIVHLQVQEGALMPHGMIDETTLRWVPVSDMRITDRFVYNRQHYFTMNWENRALDLDVLQGDNSKLASHQGFVLTGIKFKLIGSHLNFEVRMTPFDFDTGKLYKPDVSSEWLDNSNTEFSAKKRNKIMLGKVDVPTRSQLPNSIVSDHNEFIEFSHTDFDKDAAQTTVPFLDSQPVTTVIPTPLSGAGIYLRKTGEYGGFVGLKVLTYNFANHLDFELPEHPTFPEHAELSEPESN